LSLSFHPLSLSCFFIGLMFCPPVNWCMTPTFCLVMTEKVKVLVVLRVVLKTPQPDFLGCFYYKGDRVKCLCSLKCVFTKTDIPAVYLTRVGWSCSAGT
jgi:hypothetical protein